VGGASTVLKAPLVGSSFLPRASLPLPWLLPPVTVFDPPRPAAFVDCAHAPSFLGGPEGPAGYKIPLILKCTYADIS